MSIIRQVCHPGTGSGEDPATLSFEVCGRKSKYLLFQFPAFLQLADALDQFDHGINVSELEQHEARNNGMAYQSDSRAASDSLSGSCSRIGRKTTRITVTRPYFWILDSTSVNNSGCSPGLNFPAEILPVSHLTYMLPAGIRKQLQIISSILFTCLVLKVEAVNDFTCRSGLEGIKTKGGEARRGASLRLPFETARLPLSRPPRPRTIYVL